MLETLCFKQIKLVLKEEVEVTTKCYHHAVTYCCHILTYSQSDV